MKLLSHTRINGQDYFCWYLKFPTVLLQQLNTHRAFSRNVSSTRAISHKRMRRRVLLDPFIPTMTKNKKGMSGDVLDPIDAWWAYSLYEDARLPILFIHWLLERAGIHKQDANRLLTPWLWSDVIISIADKHGLDNFFDLRTKEDTQPDFRKIAISMKESIRQPKLLRKYDVVLPTYGIVPLDELDEYTLFSVAGNLARVSYANTKMEKVEPNKRDYNLGRKLLENKHLSPFEHIVVAIGDNRKYHNRVGYINIRQLLTDEPFPVCGDGSELREKVRTKFT